MRFHCIIIYYYYYDYPDLHIWPVPLGGSLKGQIGEDGRTAAPDVHPKHVSSPLSHHTQDLVTFGWDVLGSEDGI